MREGSEVVTTGEESGRGTYYGAGGSDVPAVRDAVDEAGEGYGGGVTDHGGEGGDEGPGEEDQETIGEFGPPISNRRKPMKYSFMVNNPQQYPNIYYSYSGTSNDLLC